MSWSGIITQPSMTFTMLIIHYNRDGSTIDSANTFRVVETDPELGQNINQLPAR